MSTTKTIQDRLNEKADKQLDAELDKVFQPLHGVGSNIGSALYGFQLADPVSGEKLNGYAVLERLKKMARTAAQEERRDRETEFFLAEVEDLREQLNSLPQ